MKKTYWAVVESGSGIGQRQGVINIGILDESNKLRGSLSATTEYKVLATAKQHTLLQLSPISGESSFHLRQSPDSGLDEFLPAGSACSDSSDLDMASLHCLQMHSAAHCVRRPEKHAV